MSLLKGAPGAIKRAKNVCCSWSITFEFVIVPLNFPERTYTDCKERCVLDECYSFHGRAPFLVISSILFSTE